MTHISGFFRCGESFDGFATIAVMRDAFYFIIFSRHSMHSIHFLNKSVTVLQKSAGDSRETYGSKLAAIWRGRHCENISTPSEHMVAKLRENVNVWDAGLWSQRFDLVGIS